MAFLDSIRDRFWEHLRDEVTLAAAPDGRVECSTMFFYDDGDAVVVWVESDDRGSITVADFNEAWSRVTLRGDSVDAARARALCERLGVGFQHGSVIGRASQAESGDLILRVAEASARIASISIEGPIDDPNSQKGETSRFRSLVADTFKKRDLDVATNLPVVGNSGKSYKIPIFLPNTELLVNAMPARGPGSQLSSVFMSFADLEGLNGYHPFTILDDRRGSPKEETVGLLNQVSQTALWSEREEWLPGVVSAEAGHPGR